VLTWVDADAVRERRRSLALSRRSTVQLSTAALRRACCVPSVVVSHRAPVRTGFAEAQQEQWQALIAAASSTVAQAKASSCGVDWRRGINHALLLCVGYGLQATGRGESPASVLMVIRHLRNKSMKSALVSATIAPSTCIKGTINGHQTLANQLKALPLGLVNPWHTC